MFNIRCFALPALAALVVSCTSNQNQPDAYGADPYSDPYGSPNLPYDANPVYDTPAAYEDSGAQSSTTYHPPADTGSSSPAAGSSALGGSRPATTHVVVAGDTLSKISARYGVPMAAIKEANNMTSDVVVLGRTLRIPAGGTAAKPAAAAAAGGRTHVIVSGDTLGKIAMKYGVSTASIKRANNMTSDTVVLGRKLIIPAN